MDRPTFDELFIAMALLYSTRASCDRLHTATVLVDTNNRLISAGYNGGIAGGADCDRNGHLIIEGHCQLTNHGEMNAIFNANYLSRLRESTAMIVGSPCYSCARSLITLGIKRIVYIGKYKNSQGANLVASLCQDHSVEIENVSADRARDIMNRLVARVEIKE